MTDLFVDNTVVELCELGTVPAVGCTDKVARDSLQTVDVGASALGTNREVLDGILMSAIHTTVSIVVDRAVADIVLIHQIDYLRDSLGIVSCVTIDLHVEDMASTGQSVIRSLDTSFMCGAAMIVDRNMVGVGIIVLIGYTGNDTKRLAVGSRKLTRKALGRSGQNREVVAITLGELINTAAHVTHNSESQGLRLLTLAMMLTCQGNKTLGKTYETDAESTLIDD